MSYIQYFLKEEYRYYSERFGKFLFLLFSIFGFSIGFSIFLFLPYIVEAFNFKELIIIILGVMFFLGINTGVYSAFIYFKNKSNKKEFSIISTTGILPIDEAKIRRYHNFKDLFYYLFLWILPFLIGISISYLSFAKNNFTYFNQFEKIGFFVLLMMYLLGHAITLFFASLYFQNKKTSLILMLISIGTFIFGYLQLRQNLLDKIINLVFNSFFLIICFFLFVSLFYISSNFKENENSNKKKIKKQIKLENKLLNIFFKKDNIKYIVIKNLIDFKRSPGGYGKLIFLFLVPYLMVLLVLKLFSRFVDLFNTAEIFSILFGQFLATTYITLTEFEEPNQYLIYPIKLKKIINSKMMLYFLINSIGILFILYESKQDIILFLKSVLLFLIVQTYAFAITFYLGGLRPHIRLYNARIFLKYIVYILPFLITLIVLNSFSFYYSIPILIFLLFRSFYLINLGIQKWTYLEKEF